MKVIGCLQSLWSLSLASGYHGGLIIVKPLAGGRVIGSTSDGGPQKACQGGAGLILAPTVDERIRIERGQPPGSSSATMPLSAEVYATSTINLHM